MTINTVLQNFGSAAAIAALIAFVTTFTKAQLAQAGRPNLLTDHRTVLFTWVAGPVIALIIHGLNARSPVPVQTDTSLVGALVLGIQASFMSNGGYSAWQKFKARYGQAPAGGDA